MKCRLIVCLLMGTWLAQAQNVQWHIWVPQDGITVQGIYGDHNQPIIDGFDFSSLDLTTWLPFDIPDQTAITAMTLEPVDEGFALWLSLATPVAGYLPGDVMRCEAGSCALAFSAEQELMTPAHVAVDAVALNSFGGLNLSFDSGFEYDGNYIDPQGLYLVGTAVGNLVLVEQSNGSLLGMSEPSNLSSYGLSYNTQGVTNYYGGDVVYSRPNEVIFTNEMLVIPSQDPSGYYATGFSDETQDVGAFHSLTTGNMDFSDSSVVVSEGDGSLAIRVNRMNGFEGFVRVRMVVLNGGTAVENVDFEIVNPTVQWLDGETTEQTIQLNLLDNAVMDGTRNVFFILESDSLFASISGFSSFLEVVITDDDDDLIFADDFE